MESRQAAHLQLDQATSVGMPGLPQGCPSTLMPALCRVKRQAWPSMCQAAAPPVLTVHSSLALLYPPRASAMPPTRIRACKPWLQTCCSGRRSRRSCWQKRRPLGCWAKASRCAPGRSQRPACSPWRSHAPSLVLQFCLQLCALVSSGRRPPWQCVTRQAPCPDPSPACAGLARDAGVCVRWARRGRAERGESCMGRSGLFEP